MQQPWMTGDELPRIREQVAEKMRRYAEELKRQGFGWGASAGLAVGLLVAVASVSPEWGDIGPPFCTFLASGAIGFCSAVGGLIGAAVAGDGPGGDTSR